MSKIMEFSIVDIHNPDELSLFGQKLVVVEGKEEIVDMTDDEIEAHFGGPLSDEYRDTPRAKG